MHFNRNGTPNGWQYRTLPRFLIPVGVQVMLAGLFSSVAGLLLSRRSPLRCARSGGWVGDSYSCRVSQRSDSGPDDFSGNIVGFRVVRNP